MKITDRFGNKKEHDHTIQDHCINCGAPLEHSYNHKCQYCGTLYDFNAPKEEVVELHPWDLVEVKYRDMCYDHLRNSIIIRFEGIKLETPKIYEFDGNDTYISKATNWRNPPKAYFCIELDKFRLEEYGLRYLEGEILSLLRPNEIEDVRKQIFEIEKDLFREARLRLRESI